MKHKRLKEYIKKVIKDVMKEANATGGGAHFSAGTGMTYATPFAFDKKKNKDGASPKVYNMLGYRKVGKIKHTFDVEKWY